MADSMSWGFASALLIEVVVFTLVRVSIRRTYK
jgi:hypothetical protein